MDYLDIAINYRTIIGSSRIYCQIVVNSFYFLLTILNELCLTEPDLTKIILHISRANILDNLHLKVLLREVFAFGGVIRRLTLLNAVEQPGQWYAIQSNRT